MVTQIGNQHVWRDGKTTALSLAAKQLFQNIWSSAANVVCSCAVIRTQTIDAKRITSKKMGSETNTPPERDEKWAV